MDGVNMAYLGIQPPANTIVFGGNAHKIIQKIETATGCYPGRLVIKGTNDDDVKIGDGINTPAGWLGYEQADPEFAPDSITSLYAVNAQAPVMAGPGFIKMPSGLAAKTVATKNDYLLSWSNGLVVPGVYLGGRLAVKVPFSKSLTEVQTITLPAGAIVRAVIPYCVTNASGGTIDIGTLSSDSGDADGFVDGASLTNAGFVLPNIADTTAGSITVGALLKEHAVVDATASTPYTVAVQNGYVVPAGGKVLTYATSDHTVAGFIYVVMESPGIIPVGKALLSANAASADADICLKSLI